MKGFAKTMAGIMVVLTLIAFSFAGCNETVVDIIPVPARGRIVILQAYGNAGSGSPAGLSHSFVELFNISDEDIDLDGVSLFFADGKSVPAGGINNAAEDYPWQKIALQGTIYAGHSFLILGAKHPDAAENITTHIIEDGYGDMNEPGLSLSRRAFKAALIQRSEPLTYQNPFTANRGRPIDGYIDMVGTINDEARDSIFGFERSPARNSASVAVRRRDNRDFDNNAADFIQARYGGSGSFSDEELELRRPRNHSYGSWDPWVASAEPPPQTVTPISETILILQANTFGNNNGGFSASLVELFNITYTDINLDEYYLHIGNATTWTYVIPLTGTIPARISFLVVSTNDLNANPRFRAYLPEADIEYEFRISNDDFKVALFRNQPTILTAGNPSFDIAFYDYLVDMLGVGSAAGETASFTLGSATADNTQARPRPVRRASLIDTNNNSVDFDLYNTHRGQTYIPNNELYRFWPRNAQMEQWHPITGQPRVDPVFNQAWNP